MWWSDLIKQHFFLNSTHVIVELHYFSLWSVTVSSGTNSNKVTLALGFSVKTLLKKNREFCFNLA